MPDALGGDIQEKIEKKLDKSKFGRWLKTIGALIVIPLATFCGEQVWKTYESFKALQEEVHDLKVNAANNQAIWNAIAENRNRNNEMKVEVEVIKRLFDREFARGGGKEVKPPVVPLIPTFPVPDPAPKLTPPLEKPVPVNPDQFRSEEEQKFPIQKQYKK